MVNLVDLTVLKAIEQRVLWLAMRMVDYVNRSDDAELKVGGHQSSSASMVSLMTALWFGHMKTNDKVAVKPHASPVLHAIQYLRGELDRDYLTRLRRLGGLQAYPSRTKDPYPVDFSTGSVGLGAVAPVFSAAVRRYIELHFGQLDPIRFIALLGDAELDEGNVWEAVSDPNLAGLENVMLVVDANRQSLDRIVPGIAISRLRRFFEEAGWHVSEAKYGTRLQTAFTNPGGEALQEHIDQMPNEQYQNLFSLENNELRERFLDGAPRKVRAAVGDIGDTDFADLIFDLGGHDLGSLLECFRACDLEVDRPSVVFAYTIKGYGLPFAGDPLNHAALLTPAQIDELRARVGLTTETEWDRFDPDSLEGRLCVRAGRATSDLVVPPRPRLPVPVSTLGDSAARPTSTQEAFGRILVRLRGVNDVGNRIITASPDVSISTNLGGWINKAGVFTPQDQSDHFGGGGLLRWKPGPTGQHFELGLSEMNLFLMLGQLGLSHEHHGEMLLPVGTVYDSFVLRGLDAFLYGVYSGSRFVVVGTPSGVTLAPEGGAHQSSVTASMGMELPGVLFSEPAYSTALDWMLCAGLRQLSDPSGSSAYFRLSTRVIDQGPFLAVLDSLGDVQLRDQVLAGGYQLTTPQHGDLLPVVLAASGAVMPEVLTAAEDLREEGVGATVLDLTSLDRLYADWCGSLQNSTQRVSRPSAKHHLATLIPLPLRSAPIVTIHDAASHAMAWLGSVFGQQVVPVGVDEFGESGTLQELYGRFGFLPDQIVNAALVALAHNGDI